MEKLWGNTIPYWNDKYIEEEETKPRIPTITAYPANSKGAVVIFAGGGYAMRAPHEGPEYAKWLQKIGITAFVADYRVAPYKHPAQISDAMRAVKYVRHYADKYGYDKDKIAVMGSSAGGHLAGSVSVHFDKKMYDATDEIDQEDCRPNATILCYPVIDMLEYRHDGSRQNLLGERTLHEMKDFMSLYKQVSYDTPPAFIWHTASDQAVPVENSLLYADALSKKQIPFELHIYPFGPHGLGLAEEMPHVAQWKKSLENWLALIDWK